MTPTLLVRRLTPSALPPAYQTAGAAGLDLHADERVGLVPGGWWCIRTGIAIELPVGYEAQIRPRSGLAFDMGVTVLNAPGTLDADFRGEVKVLLINHGGLPWECKPGDRIAQMVIAPCVRADVREVFQLSDTARGEGGFGSTDRRA